MKIRFIVGGILIGIIVGVVVSLLFPNLLTTGVNFNNSLRKSQGFPDYVISSILDGLYFYPLILGLAGGVVGFLVFKLVPKRE
jgi:H+/Cl- antiporter ClcA